jgi:hypothetical protein
MYIYNWYHSIIASIHLYTRTQITMYMTHSPCFIISPCWFPLLSFPIPFTYLETLLAVTGSVHLGLCLLVNWPPHFPSLAHIPLTPKSQPPPGFLTSKYTFLRMASRTWLTRSSTVLSYLAPHYCCLLCQVFSYLVFML